MIYVGSKVFTVLHCTVKCNYNLNVQNNTNKKVTVSSHAQYWQIKIYTYVCFFFVGGGGGHVRPPPPPGPP